MNVKVWGTLLVLSLLSYGATSCGVLQNMPDEDRRAIMDNTSAIGQTILKTLADSGSLAPEVAAAGGGLLTALLGFGLSLFTTTRKAKTRTGVLLGEVADLKRAVNGKPPA